MGELHTTSEDGTPITAIDQGAGPVALLVVHPGGQDETAWDAVAALLAEDFRVVRIRRRIYAGGGAAARAGPTVATEAADILAVAGQIDGPVFLVGHSSGAVAALEAALRDPAAFTGLLAYEPPLPTSTLVGGEALGRARAALDAGDPLEAMRIHLRDIVLIPAPMVDAILRDPQGQAQLLASAEAQIVDDEALDALGVGCERFAALGLPTTLLQGDQSPDHLLDRTADLAAVLPDARVVTLPGQGHVANLMAPHLLAAEIRAAATRGE
ncbi:MAG TPA: alpha/beta hydrolase [Actinocrinis sp.]|nr:alpha/beta hydrolase [Actinocrinis sp.]